MTTPATIGSRIRSFRERLEMSVTDFAKQTRFDESLINSIEADEVYPSIGTLSRIARALGQRLGTFMDDQYKPDPLIVRAGSRQAGQTTHKAPAVADGFSYSPLSRGKTDRHMDAFYIEIAPDAGELLSSHEGEEFIVVISGEVELSYGGDTHLLGPGDSAHYNSIGRHLVKAHGDAPATIYAVVFIPF
ncbi:MAG: cupin domain-containing protein [Lentisphaerae bacterium]|nr:cupin domain-containing protein [Lentisphaerota bacterium]